MAVRWLIYSGETWEDSNSYWFTGPDAVTPAGPPENGDEVHISVNIWPASGFDGDLNLHGSATYDPPWNVGGYITIHDTAIFAPTSGCTGGFTFRDSSQLAGNLDGWAKFYDSSFCYSGQVNSDADFYDSSACVSLTVIGQARFHDTAHLYFIDCADVTVESGVATAVYGECCDPAADNYVGPEGFRFGDYGWATYYSAYCEITGGVGNVMLGPDGDVGNVANWVVTDPGHHAASLPDLTTDVILGDYLTIYGTLNCRNCIVGSSDVSGLTINLAGSLTFGSGVIASVNAAAGSPPSDILGAGLL